MLAIAYQQEDQMKDYGFETMIWILTQGKFRHIFILPLLDTETPDQE